MMKWLPIAVLLGIGIVGWLVYAEAADELPVPAAAVKQGEIREFVDERGLTRLPKTHLITMPYTGRIAEITIREGSPVQQGQIVAQVVPADLELAIDGAQAAIERLKAAIVENDDESVEQTALKQALEFVASMEHTVSAAGERVKSGKARLEFADSQLRRVKQLEPTRAVTREEVERTQVDQLESYFNLSQDELVQSAMFALKTATGLLPEMVQEYIGRKKLSTEVLKRQMAEAHVSLSRALLDENRGELRSPIDGVVLSREISNERYISAGTVLLQLGSLDQLEIEADILSQDVVRVKVNDEVEIYGPTIGPKPATGVVTQIFPSGFTKVSSLGVEQQRVKVLVKMTDDDLQRLLYNQNMGVGYRVRVRIFTAQKSGALVAPRSALFRGEDGQWQVFAVRDGRAQRLAIEVGLMNDDTVEVIRGLEVDDLVVLAPERDLNDGQRVQPITTTLSTNSYLDAIQD